MAHPGQFVMLRVSENMDPLLARPFGISSLPSRSSLELIYRVVGKGTSLLTQRKEGTSLNILGPIGNGFPLPERGTTPVLIAGGSGFPPLHFLSLKAGSRAHLFVGARNKDCLPPVTIVKSFRAAVEKVHLATDDGSAGERGVTADLLSAYLTAMERKTHLVLYACGPHAMLSAVSRIASMHSLPCYVSMEERMACGVGACMGCSVEMRTGEYKRVCKDGPVFASKDIEWGDQVSVKLVRGIREDRHE
jgi:dihydroorotate dehydrogenase electron transfer subunit